MNLWDAHVSFLDGQERIILKHDLAIQAAKRDLKKIAYELSHQQCSIEEFDEKMDPHIDAYLRVTDEIDRFYAKKIQALQHTEVDDIV